MPGRQTIKELSDLNKCFGVDYLDDEANIYQFYWQMTLVPLKGILYERSFFKLEVKLQMIIQI